MFLYLVSDTDNSAIAGVSCVHTVTLTIFISINIRQKWAQSWFWKSNLTQICFSLLGVLLQVLICDLLNNNWYIDIKCTSTTVHADGTSSIANEDKCSGKSWLWKFYCLRNSVGKYNFRLANWQFRITKFLYLLPSLFNAPTIFSSPQLCASELFWFDFVSHSKVIVVLFLINHWWYPYGTTT